MPKRVAIIDIGSNSARVVIYHRTSRFGFHLIAQKKAAVRISEGSFDNNGILQENAIERTIEALHTFKSIISDYKARKTIIVATAAVRNAPNRDTFIQRVRKELGLKIKVIDGNKEAFFGAVAATNLLPLKSTAITVDIGGGSTDIALIEDNKVIDTLSIKIGTITIKELFFDKQKPLSKTKEYINSLLEDIPEKFQQATEVIAIGGVLRAVAKSIIMHSNYSYSKIHAFNYQYSDYAEHIASIIDAKDSKELNTLWIKPGRYDTIREGLLIFTMLLKKLGIQSVLTSGVGVREGVFLHDMLRGVGGLFPKDLNPSVVSIIDRLDMIQQPKAPRIAIMRTLFNTLKGELKNREEYLKLLKDAVKISDCGKTLTIYDEHKHTYYIAMQELNWQYTHQEMLLIAAILRSTGEKLLYKTLQKEHQKILPGKKVLRWLAFIYTLSNRLSSYSLKNRYSFHFEDKVLTIKSNSPLYLFEQDLKNLELPEDIVIRVANRY
ncbi:MAG TPA: Ppx/GppA family phosphatase [Nitratifractor sp.]|nr:Ppx/GppA family phosphatase [Nitratifractor sp.]HHD74326.1 Ppx/GppA family phosphatase [Nitratifractor sp.]